jgi:diaminopimelate decarboxylase
MEDKEALGERVDALLVNPNAIQEVRVFNAQKIPVLDIPNADGKRMSLQIYASITDNESRITPQAAERGLGIFGVDLVTEAILREGKHQSIDLLRKIAKGEESYYSHVVTPFFTKPIPEHVLGAMPEIARTFGTPIHVYDEAGIREKCRALNRAFSWVPNNGFRNYFAVKACPNPTLLEIMREEGLGADCSSLPELRLARAVGMNKEDMMFTSNDTPDIEFIAAQGLGAVMNLDDITHIAALERATGNLPSLLCFRYAGDEVGGNSIIGNVEERKYGLTREQLFEAYRIAKEKGVKLFGLHTMMASNERNPATLERQARIMFQLAVDLKKELGINIAFINLGGGIGTAYRPWDREVDLNDVGRRISKAYIETLAGVSCPNIFTECGRVITGPHGWLLTGVRHVMQKHRAYVGVDATMADLMRPGMYGAYHHITVLGKESVSSMRIYDVVGSLCENCDKFAVQRFLPGVQKGNLMAIHNAGAHGRAMCFNYNAKLRSGEVLVKTDGSLQLIRRPETEDDYFATLDFPGSKYADLAHSK